MNEAKYIVSQELTEASEHRALVLMHARALVDAEPTFLANCANLSSLIFHSLRDVNWCGFYFVHRDALVLGPFQGKPACTRITIGRGVCGTAAKERRTVLVDDVLAFPGHIACDADSRSELVIPLMSKDTLLGVFDLDSPVPARFRQYEQELLEEVVRVLVEGSDLTL